MARTDAEKAQIEASARTLIEQTGAFCDQYLDAEYKELVEKLILKMKRKRTVPFLSGRVSVWAAAVLYALGQINWLFDADSQPHVAPADIAKHFGVAQSTVSQKAKTIRDMFDMDGWNSEFATQANRRENPMADMVMVNGFVVPLKMLPPEIQEQVRLQRASG
jgi:hypothetical protein